MATSQWSPSCILWWPFLQANLVCCHHTIVNVLKPSINHQFGMAYTSHFWNICDVFFFLVSHILSEDTHPNMIGHCIACPSLSNDTAGDVFTRVRIGVKKCAKTRRCLVNRQVVLSCTSLSIIYIYSIYIYIVYIYILYIYIVYIYIYYIYIYILYIYRSGWPTCVQSMWMSFGNGHFWWALFQNSREYFLYLDQWEWENG